MNVELTNYSTPQDALVPKVVELIKRHKVEEKALFSSFLAGNLQKARRLLPSVPRALLTLPGFLGLWGRSVGWRGDYSALNPFMKDVKVGLITRLHKAGKRVYTWTVTEEVDIKCMISLGVDGIITDDPGLTLHLLGRDK